MGQKGQQTRKKKTVCLHDIHYAKPTKKDLAVGLVFFNSSKSVRLLTNYLYVVEKLKCADIPYYTLEMYTDTPEINDAFHIKTDIILFQKERLCHLLEKKIPATYTKLIFIDCDVIFEDESWYSKLSNALDTYEVIQPFSKWITLDVTFNHLDNGGALVSMTFMYGEDGHNGFAWAFQRNWFREKGFYQYAILGGGDSKSSSAYMRKERVNDAELLEKYKNVPSMTEYIKRIGDVKLSYLKGTVYHLFHGPIRKRNYRARHAILKDYKDPKDAVRVTKSGAFTLRNKTLKSKVQKYFKGRDDDGI